MMQQQQARAIIAAHQAAHDSVAFHIMMGESAAHSSMSTSVSNEQSPSAGRKAGAGGFYFQSLTQLDGSHPLDLPLLLRLPHHALPLLLQRFQAPGTLNFRHVNPHV